jgi:uncharacterized protein YkwD
MFLVQIARRFRPTTVALLGLALAVLTSSLLLTGVGEAASGGSRMIQMGKEINAFRAQNGLPPLTFKNKLISVARDYAVVMKTKDQMGHSVDGTTVAQRLDKGGYKYARYFENVAWNKGHADAAAQAVKSWKESTSGHREAMLSRDVTEMGIGLARSSTGKEYFCLVLAKPR